MDRKYGEKKAETIYKEVHGKRAIQYWIWKGKFTEGKEHLIPWEVLGKAMKTAPEQLRWFVTNTYRECVESTNSWSSGRKKHQISVLGAGNMRALGMYGHVQPRRQPIYEMNAWTNWNLGFPAQLQIRLLHKQFYRGWRIGAQGHMQKGTNLRRISNGAFSSRMILGGHRKNFDEVTN